MESYRRINRVRLSGEKNPSYLPVSDGYGVTPVKTRPQTRYSPVRRIFPPAGDRGNVTIVIRTRSLRSDWLTLYTTTTSFYYKHD